LFDDGLAVRRSKLSDEVVSRLMSMIRDGRLQPGDRLPPERQLASSFHVSRASLRDAVRHLELLGYLEVRQGDGTVVRLPDAATLTQPFQGLLAGHPQAAADLLEFRRMLEPQVAALAAERCSLEQGALLDQAIAVQRSTVERGERLGQEDVDFHQLIASIAGNATVLQVLETLGSLLAEMRTRHLSGDKPHLGFDQHVAIAEAIRAGRPAVAAQAMGEHLDAVQESMLDGLEPAPHEPGRPSPRVPADPKP
jgi:GntR family transcriptional repressor for pyruvate dehydrogenase complex